MSAIRKGSTFERKISKILSEWVSDGKDKYIYNRRQGSGGAFRDKSGQSGIRGDIHCEKKEYEWLTNNVVFELKHYKDLTGELWKYILGEKSIIQKFLDQVILESKGSSRKFLLLMKTNNKKEIIITDINVTMLEYNFKDIRINNKVEIYNGIDKYYIFSFSEFLKINSNNLKTILEVNNNERQNNG